MSLKDLLKRIEYEVDNREHSMPTLTKEALCVAPDFFDEEYFKLFDDWNSANEYRHSIREMVINACEHGNKFDPSKQVTVKYFVGRKGMLTEVTDEGEGIPIELSQRIKKGNYYEQFANDHRGRGFHGLNHRLCEGIIDGIEIEGTSIRLLKMYSKS
ncbi:MAG: ATP-binding protein [Nanoarchaeota archaeon]